MYKVMLKKKAKKDKNKIKNAKLDKKVDELISVLEKNPFQSPPPYKALTGDLQGFYSRRINYQHRLVYRVISGEFTENGKNYSGVVTIERMWTHYEGILSLLS